MNNKRKKGFWIQIIAGLLTFVFGCLTCVYGYCSLVGKINGNMVVYLILLIVCFVSIIICINSILKNIKKCKEMDGE